MNVCIPLTTIHNAFHKVTDGTHWYTTAKLAPASKSVLLSIPYSDTSFYGKKMKVHILN